MAITTEDIKKLRDRTGVSVMQCKSALEEAEGDEEKALIILQKKSKAIADKKSERQLKAGVIESYIHNTGTVGTLVELACETDFVAKNEEFKGLAREIALHVTAMNPKFIKSEEITEDIKKQAREVFEPELEGKPEDMKEKIMEGKLSSYFDEQTLYNQEYVKDTAKTIKDLIESGIQKFGENIDVIRFQRFEVGKE